MKHIRIASNQVVQQKLDTVYKLEQKKKNTGTRADSNNEY